MAEGIVFDLAGRILEVLGSQVFQEIELASGVKDDIKKLTETVSGIKAVLLDAERQHSKKNVLVTQWLGRLKDVFYDADDLLDDFSTELKQRQMMTGNKVVKEVRIFLSKSNQIAYSLKMAHKIKAIRERLDDIAKDMGQFNFIQRQVDKRMLNTERETYSYARAEDVIGRDDDKEAIMQLLSDSNDVENLSVIPIVGIGGLGKTTLAQLVYNDEKVKNHFDLRMWVCVSDDFNVETIVKNIIKSANSMIVGLIENLKMEQLQQCLRKEIDGKKYLLVLDDIWNDNRDMWLKLKTLLMNDMRGSKILVTTRSIKVADITSELSPYVLKGLNEDMSWSLFTRVTFKHGIEPKESDLIEIGKRILVKCSGVPLAIRTIGRLLYNNSTVSAWQDFMENEFSKIEQEESDILPMLKLSYDHLSSHLKQCFAYCALFPKDYEFNKESLINLWMAQGFLQSSNTNQCLEDVGNKYFMNLVSGSFLQDVKYDEERNTTTCKMHDLVHDLATLVAKPECILAKLEATNVDDKARHISFSSQSWPRDIPTALLRVKHIRTFLLSDLYGNNYLEMSNCSKLLSSFRCLRTLNLRASVMEVPNSIGKLKHLRWLDLSCNSGVTRLPNSITKLRNLQILNLTRCGFLRRLPRDISRMVSLRCLMIDYCGSLVGMPRGLGQLTSLSNLSCFYLGKEKGHIADLSELNKLLNHLRGRLTICGLENATSTRSTLANLKANQHLERLALRWSPPCFEIGPMVRSHDAVLEGLQPHQNLKRLEIYKFNGWRIANWISSVTKVTKIEFSDFTRCEHVPALDQLPCLKSLAFRKLEDLVYISEQRSTMSTSFFPFLKELVISECCKLKGWWWIDSDSDEQMPELPSFHCLSKLQILDCPSLNSMPLHPSLEGLTLGARHPLVSPTM